MSPVKFSPGWASSLPASATRRTRAPSGVELPSCLLIELLANRAFHDDTTAIRDPVLSHGHLCDH